MRIVSLRWFRQDIAGLTEPVQVARRRKGSPSEIDILGTWTPTAWEHLQAIDRIMEPLHGLEIALGGPISGVLDEEEVIPSRRPFRPAPKPGGRR